MMPGTPTDEFADRTDFAEPEHRAWVSPHGVVYKLGRNGQQTHGDWAYQNVEKITGRDHVPGDTSSLNHPFYKALDSGWIRKVSRRRYHVGDEKHIDSVRLHVALHHPEVRRIKVAVEGIGHSRAFSRIIDMKGSRVDEAYVGYKLSPEARGKLLRAFPPHYENVVAHHVTTDFLGNRQTAFLPPAGKVTVIGHAHDPERGIHAAVVRVGDLTHQSMEPSNLLHVTISHRKGARPVHSNDAIKKGWKPVEPFEIEATPFLGEGVFRADPEGTTIDRDNLHRYFASPDWSTSGVAVDGQRKPRGAIEAQGLFAGRNKRSVAPYTVPRDVPWVRYFHAKTGRPTIAFAKDDEPRIRDHRAVLSKYKGSRFEKLPSGERFSSDPGDPVKQKAVGKPVKFLRKSGYDVKFVDDLKAHHQKAQAKHHEVESEGRMFESAGDNRVGWITPKGEFHPLPTLMSEHAQWIKDNHELVNSYGHQHVTKDDLKLRNDDIADHVHSSMIRHGWIRKSAADAYECRAGDEKRALEHMALNHKGWKEATLDVHKRNGSIVSKVMPNPYHVSEGRAVALIRQALSEYNPESC